MRPDNTKHLKGIAAVCGSALLLFIFTGCGFSPAEKFHIDISFLYPEAADSLNPNGSRFDPDIISSEDFLSQFREQFGEDLAGHITVRPAESDKDSGVFAEYRIGCTAYDNCDEILETIAHAYADDFISKYTAYDAELTYAGPESSLDRAGLANHLEKEVNCINTYISEHEEQFTALGNINGMTYDELREYGQSIIDSDIPALRSYVNGAGAGTVDAMIMSVEGKLTDLIGRATVFSKTANEQNGPTLISISEPKEN